MKRFLQWMVRKPNDKARERASSIVNFFLEAGRVFILVTAIVLPVRYFLIQPFYVKGASMEPAFFDHEYLIIDEISYRLRDPQRGEIVVFRYPGDPSQFFIKRVIGLPGETVSVHRGIVRVSNDAFPEGVELEEPYLGAEQTAGEKDVQLDDQEYYLLGDHRSASYDSRFFGPIPRERIVGRVWLRGYPLQRFGVFSVPADTLPSS